MTDRYDRRSGVLVVGSANMDLVVRCDTFPKPGQTILGTDFAMFPGGKGANQAVAAAKLGAEVFFMGKMGRDVFRDRLRASLEHDGVRLDYLLEDPDAATGTALITVDASGQNQIIVASGSNMRLTPDEVEARREVFSRVGVVLLQLEIPLDTVQASARLAREAGCRVILNPAPAPARALPQELIRMVDLLTPNESEAEVLSSLPVTDEATATAAAERLVGMGVGEVIVTLGRRGALHVVGGEAAHYEARVVEAVDSTAAGDAFNGALAFGLSAGMCVSDAIPLANAVAACSVTRQGAQPSMPDADELAEFAPDLAAAAWPSPTK